MNATEADRERAHRMLSREARLEDVDAVAEALAAEREAARAPFLALADDLRVEAVYQEPWDGNCVAAYEDISDRIRIAARQQQ